MEEPARGSIPSHLAPPALRWHLSHIWAAPVPQSSWAELTAGSRPQAVLALKEKRGKWRWLPKVCSTWEDPEFETQIHSSVNPGRISLIIQPVPHSKCALPLSHLGAGAVMGLSDISQRNNLPREAAVWSQWKLCINSNLLIGLPHFLPQICEEKGKEKMLIF